MGREHARLPSTDDDTNSSDDGRSSASSRSSRSDGSRRNSDRDTDDDAQDTEDEDVEETPPRHSRCSSVLLVVLLLLLLCGTLGVAAWFWWSKSGSSATNVASTVTATASPAESGGIGGTDGAGSSGEETGQSATDAQATGGAGGSDSNSGTTAHSRVLPTGIGPSQAIMPSRSGPQQAATSSKTSTLAGSESAPTKAPSTNLKTCKKGTGYNDAKLTLQLNLCWAYNWAAAPGGTLGNGVMYVPMLWGNTDQYTTDWDKNARAAISAGATHVFGFNEPDLDTQSNISPKDAADAWKQHIEPLAGSAKLVSPAVTNGVKSASGAPMGVAWLKEFMAACTGCTIDAFALHWYDAASNTAYFTSYLEQASKDLAKPIWLTEFMSTGSATDQATFLKFADPWLEKQTFIEKYAAFGDFASNPVAVFVDQDGTPNDLGKVYAVA
ncbi:glycoside hydrolase [Rhodotorula toruloides]|uniref:Glycoside hydrolase n=1 Tax=Rhodotorula toruloides TaxID=5286 RepID=A0A511KDF9_RHOTO|nr:glycoside hydrolase [Rhodotorula toruloides]